MGSSVYPAASSGGGGAPVAKGGTLVASGSTLSKGYYLSPTLPAGDYIVVGDLEKTYQDQYQDYFSASALKSNFYYYGNSIGASDPVRITLTESDKICLSAPLVKAGPQHFATDDMAGIIHDAGYNWNARANQVTKLYNTDKYISWIGYDGDSASNQVGYTNLGDLSSLDAFFAANTSASTNDSTISYNRACSGGGLVGNYFWFSFLAGTASQRLWRANVNTPTTWTVGTTAATTDGAIFAIAYDGTTYVMVTGAGHINTSADFSTWTKQTSPATDQLRDIEYANGMFVAVGMSGNILTSSNGFTWTKRTAPADATHYYCVRYFNGKWYAFGGGPDSSSYPWAGEKNKKYFASSTDGITWTSFDIQIGQAALNVSSTYKYGTFVPNIRHGYQQSSQNEKYGQKAAYVYNGYLCVDVSPDKKFITEDGTNWYGMYKTWDNEQIMTSPTHGLLWVQTQNYGNLKQLMYIRRPGNHRFYIYQETA
jgi:hypothetical protein